MQPPRAPRHRYCGVLAPNSPLRAAAVALAAGQGVGVGVPVFFFGPLLFGVPLGSAPRLFFGPASRSDWAPPSALLGPESGGRTEGGPAGRLPTLAAAGLATLRCTRPYDLRRSSACCASCCLASSSSFAASRSALSCLAMADPRACDWRMRSVRAESLEDRSVVCGMAACSMVAVAALIRVAGWTPWTVASAQRRRNFGP